MRMFTSIKKTRYSELNITCQTVQLHISFMAYLNVSCLNDMILGNRKSVYNVQISENQLCTEYVCVVTNKFESNTCNRKLAG